MSRIRVWQRTSASGTMIRIRINAASFWQRCVVLAMLLHERLEWRSTIAITREIARGGCMETHAVEALSLRCHFAMVHEHEYGVCVDRAADQPSHRRPIDLDLST